MLHGSHASAAGGRDRKKEKERTYNLLAEDTRTIHRVEDDPPAIARMKRQRLPKQTRRARRLELLPRGPPIAGLPMLRLAANGVRARVVEGVHGQLEQLAGGDGLDDIPGSARVGAAVDGEVMPVLEEQHVRVVEVGDGPGDEVEFGDGHPWGGLLGFAGRDYTEEEEEE